MIPDDKNQPQKVQEITDLAKASLARISLLFDDLALQTARLKQEVSQSKTEVTAALASKKF